jgi:hypothetical protein
MEISEIIILESKSRNNNWFKFNNRQVNNKCLYFCEIVLCSYMFRGVFFNLCGGTLGTAATTGLLYQPRMLGDGDCGGINGMKIGSGNRSTRRKPAPAPLCPPQIPHD